ncbi:hypothetical protein KZ847_34480, partial [Pseudomonas aeruginosa]|nr:hypothetical protein [Pseudomonas aeruginosa]
QADVRRMATEGDVAAQQAEELSPERAVVLDVDRLDQCALVELDRLFFFSSKRRHTRCSVVSWARRCV